MKVSELIEHLKMLDQERGIWIQYDSFQYFKPIPDEEATKDDEFFHSDEGVREGDYLIITS